IPLASLGYSTVAVKEVVNEPALQNRILGSVLGLNGIGAAVIFLIINGIAWWLSGAESMLLHVVSLRVLFSPASTVDVYFQSIVKARYPVLARSTGQLLSAGLRLLAVFLGVGLLWFVVIQSAVAFVVGALLVFAYTKYGTGPIRDWNWDTSTARRVALLSLPLLLTNLFNVVILRVDQVIIHQLLDEGETGVYAAAATLSEAWYFLPGAFLTSLFPLLVRTRKESETAYEEQLTILCSVFFYLALGIAVIFYFTADWVVPLLLGEAYARSSAILVVHAWAGAFVFLGRPVTKALIIADLNGYYLVMRLLAAGVNVGLNYLLIPSYGIIGAAWATLVAYAVAHVFSYA
ncbi:MAG: flippase, partial [Bacteroidota bacterium]